MFEHSRRSRKSQMSEINVVPYIDVMLVLLVIFMVTTPLLTQGVEVDLPEARSSEAPIPPRTTNLPTATTGIAGIQFTP